MSDLIAINLDATDIERLGVAMRQAGNRTPDALRRALNWSGDRAKTQVIRALTAQSGLKRQVIVRAVVSKRANYSALAYVLRSRGGNISLKYFKARETKKGVTAEPWGKRQLYNGAFIKGGRFPLRTPLALHGQVFKRTGSGRLPIQKLKSGLFIPTEMVKGATATAFMGTVTSVLPGRVAHEVGAILSGVVK